MGSRTKNSPWSWLLAAALLVTSSCSSVDSDWKEAQASDTRAAYSKFLARHADSEYAERARASIDRLCFKEAADLDTIHAYRAYVAANPNSRYATAATDRIAQLTEQSSFYITAANRALGDAARTAAIRHLTEPNLLVSAVEGDYASGRVTAHTESIVRLCELLDRGGKKGAALRKAVFEMLAATYGGSNTFQMTVANDRNAARLVARLQNKEVLEYFRKKENDLYCSQVAALKLMLQEPFIAQAYGITDVSFHLNRKLDEAGYWAYGDGSTGRQFDDVVTIVIRDSRGREICRKAFDAKGEAPVHTSVPLESGDYVSLAWIDVPRIRMALIGRITDQGLLTSIASSAALNEDARIAAISKLVDQGLLASIASNAKLAEQVRIAATSKLASQESLSDLAMRDDSVGVAMVAIGRIRDQDLLSRLARSTRAESVRRAAIERLDDQSVLEDLATHDGDASVRYAAVCRVRSDRVLAGIAKNDEMPYVRTAAKERRAKLRAAQR